MDVHDALDKADMIASGGKPYGDTAFRVIATLAAEVRRLAGADKPKPPRRAAEIDVRVGANNWDDAVRELKWTVEHVEDHGPSCQSVSGGPSGNHIVTVYQDPTMTHERYFEELDKYLAAAEAAREGRGT